MRKTYPLRPEGKHPDRVLDAVKHDIRKYLKRERRRDLPEGAHFWDFDCRFGPSQEAAQVVHMAALIAELDALAKAGAESCYVELLAKPAVRQPRPPGSPPRGEEGDHPAQSSDAFNADQPAQPAPDADPAA
jgi:hypothetical protein